MNLQTITTDIESFIGLIGPTQAAIAAVAAISPAGTEFATIMNDAKGVLTAMLGSVGAIEADIEAVWPHLVSIFTSLEKIVGAATVAPTPAPSPSAQ